VGRPSVIPRRYVDEYPNPPTPFPEASSLSVSRAMSFGEGGGPTPGDGASFNKRLDTALVPIPVGGVRPETERKVPGAAPTGPVWGSEAAFHAVGPSGTASDEAHGPCSRSNSSTPAVGGVGFPPWPSSRGL
jgi:hypothetical protein